jgi:hypothetical protein
MHNFDAYWEISCRILSRFAEDASNLTSRRQSEPNSVALRVKLYQNVSNKVKTRHETLPKGARRHATVGLEEGAWR